MAAVLLAVPLLAKAPGPVGGRDGQVVTFTAAAANALR
jgi:hypothetical protein